MLSFAQNWSSKRFQDPQNVYPLVRQFRDRGRKTISHSGNRETPASPPDQPWWTGLNAGADRCRALMDAALILARYAEGGDAAGQDAKALGDHWALDRKLRELFAPWDVSGDEANRVLEIMKAVLARTCPERAAGAAPKQKSAPADITPPMAAMQDLSPGEKLVLDNYHAEDFRKLLGVNVFDGLVWFNKEAFEEALFYAPLFAVLESDGAMEGVSRPPKKTAPAKAPADWLDRVAGIAELAETFAEAEEKAGYQLDELLGALGNKGPGTR